MRSLTIEIHGTGTHNRGAELMAIAIAERLRTIDPEVRIVVPPTFGDAQSRARHGFLTTWELTGRLRARVIQMGLMIGSSGDRKVLGIVDPSEVDLVLDASGFAFSDQQDIGGARLLLKKMNSRARQHQPLILMPQALGPFKKQEIAEVCRDLFSRSSMVCARDASSHKAALELGVPRDILRLYHDFTVGVQPARLEGLETPSSFSAIVPNYRMIDKGSSPEEYLGFLSNCLRILRLKKLTPVFVLHDSNEDNKVIRLLGDSARGISVVMHEDPRFLKAILGRANLVIGSRFHALVSSLSQGIPCIGAGWSHKYRELFADYDCPDLLMEDLQASSQLENIIQSLADPSSRFDYASRISAASEKIKRKNLFLWKEVEQLISHAPTLK